MKEIICENCLISFEVKNFVRKTRRFCCRKCYLSFIEAEKCEISCENCGKLRNIKKSQLKFGAKYCSSKCREIKEGLKKRKGSDRVCKNCNEVFHVKPCAIKRGRGSFCSKKCHNIFRERKEITECEFCNKSFVAKAGDIKRGHAKHCSKKCTSKSKSGPNSPFWKGGITSENSKIRGSEEYAEWRKAVFERDRYICQNCFDKTGNNLQAHHIKSFADYPELRFNIDNGLTLCKKCHTKTHNYGKKSGIKNRKSKNRPKS